MPPAFLRARAGWLGAALALCTAVALFTRFSLDDKLTRDEAMYTYGGQQLTEGLAPYASLFDPKTPLATILAGAGVAIARLAGADDVHTVRIVFFVFACLTVLGVYALALELW